MAVFLVVELVAGVVGVSVGNGLLGHGSEGSGVLRGWEVGGRGVDGLVEYGS